MGRLARRVGQLGQTIPAPPCLVCRDWGPVACVAKIDDPWPWPAACPGCGRDTTPVRLLGGVAWETL